MSGNLFVISAASGAGKTTILNKVLPDFPNIVYSVSATTRKPRTGELDGIHYFFKTEKEFEQMIEKDELIEWNKVHNNYYGTPKFFVEQKLSEGRSVIFDLDVFGKINFDKIYPQAIGILILLPSLEILETRLRARNTESESSLKIRLENAKKEIEFAQTKGKYQHIIYNSDLDTAVKEFKDILNMHLQSA